MDIRLPDCLWEKIKDHCPHQDLIIDIKLMDGSIRKNYLVNNKGIIQGKIVGGHDGIVIVVVILCVGIIFMAVQEDDRLVLGQSCNRIGLSLCGINRHGGS